MADEFRKPYGILFNGITDALETLERNDPTRARDLLIRAQQEAEEAYIEAE